MEDNLRKAQQIQLEMALEVRRICQKYNIKYFLDAGTLLGAIRHQGFIPWDDDLDIGLLREDYDQFLQIAKKELNSKYFLQTWYTDIDYGLPYAKIRCNNTKYIEKNSVGLNMHQGIFIDIFPYDNIPKEDFKQSIQALILRCIYKCNLIQKGYSLTNNKIQGYIISVVGGVLKKINILDNRRIYESISLKYNNIEAQKVTIADGISYKNYKIDRKILSDLIEVSFEGHYFLAPRNYHKYLTYVYGDYMILPPEGQRENRHGIIEIKFQE